jgi:hypothetical protein
MVLTFASSWTDVTIAIGSLVTGAGAILGLYLTAAAAKRERARHEVELAEERQASANYLEQQRGDAMAADRKRYLLATLSDAATSFGQFAAAVSNPEQSKIAPFLAGTLRLKLASIPGQYGVMMRLGVRVPLTPSGQQKLDWLRAMGYLGVDFQPGESKVEPGAVYAELEADVEALLSEIPQEWSTAGLAVEDGTLPQRGRN